MSRWYDPWGIASEVYHRVTGAPTADEKRNQQKMMNDQIKSYRDQTEITKQELAKKKGEEVAEKRRVEEKQIRGLRRSYRSSGFLGNPSSGAADTSNQLGG